MITFSKADIEKFKKMDILAIYLFGSMATGRYIHDRSDFDFGIVLENTKQLKGGTLELYNELYDIILEKLPKKYLKKRFALRVHEFDMVFLQQAPIKLQAQIFQEGKVLYQSNKSTLDKYRDYVLERYCDLQYVYEISRKALLERI